MLEDPHKILDVAPNASEDEIKRAYRKKAKLYHPDLHPNDPVATQKMNEINEAYDMLMNPEKYAAKRAQQTQRQQNSYGYGQQQSSGQYRGAGGWSSDFGGFGFEDFFGFGGENAQRQADIDPRAMAGDSPEIQQAVREIRERRYQQAIRILTAIPSTGRNARWYYLSALANHGLGNQVQAMDQMQRAAQMDPNNQTYIQLLRQFRRQEQTYETNAQGFQAGMPDPGKLCLGCMAVQFLCGPFSCLRCI